MKAEISHQSSRGQEEAIEPRLQLIAWEVTRSCNLFCAHCRGSAAYGHYEGELSTEECFHLINEILEIGKPVIRSTNHGVTAITDYKGTIIAQVPQFETQVLRAEVTSTKGLTPYRTLGSWPLVGLIVISLGFAGWKKRLETRD